MSALTSLCTPVVTFSLHVFWKGPKQGCKAHVGRQPGCWAGPSHVSQGPRVEDCPAQPCPATLSHSQGHVAPPSHCWCPGGTAEANHPPFAAETHLCRAQRNPRMAMASSQHISASTGLCDVMERGDDLHSRWGCCGPPCTAAMSPRRVARS